MVVVNLKLGFETVVDYSWAEMVVDFGIPVVLFVGNIVAVGPNSA